MNEKPLEDRRKALEEDYFRKESAAKVAKLQAEKERAALGAALALPEGELLDQIHALGVREASIDALAHAPFVSVAWADGRLEEPEAAAVREAFDAAGLAHGTPARELVERWLAAPPPGLFEVWESFLALAWKRPADAAKRRAAEELLRGRLRPVAVASGGFAGLGKISRSEADVLVRVMHAFLERAEG